MSSIYLDNSATTVPCPTAVKRMTDALTENYANPSSLYAPGADSQRLVESTRTLAAKFLGCEPQEVYFTSCGTESNNTAIMGAARSRKKRGNRIVSTAIEHPAVLNPLKALENEGFEVVLIKPEKDGNIPAEKFQNAINGSTVLVSAMLVNNETGARLPIEAIKKYVTDVNAPALIHCDASQGFGKIPFTVKALGVDMLTASGHKIHAPKGIGLLYINSSVHIPPLLAGGGQEKGMRSGTEPVPAIAGLMGALEELDVKKQFSAVFEISSYARQALGNLPFVTVNSPENAIPHILNISVSGYRSETLLHFLEAKGIYVSSGSACAKGHASHVLEAMDLDKDLADSALRISFSKYNTKEDIDALAAALSDAAGKLRRSNERNHFNKRR